MRAIAVGTLAWFLGAAHCRAAAIKAGEPAPLPSAPQALPAPAELIDAPLAPAFGLAPIDRPQLEASLAAPELAPAEATPRGEVWYSMPGGGAALMKRDPELSNSLLEKTRTLADWAGRQAASLAEPVARLADALLVGDYVEAARHLDRVDPAPVSPGAAKAAAALRGLLPKNNADETAALRSALAQARAPEKNDPFALQAKLSFLVHGILDHNIPEDLNDLQVWLTKKASGLARARAAERKNGPIEGPVQTEKECWLNALYFLPVPELDALRKSMPYERFLEWAAAAIPASDVIRQGLSLQQFAVLLEKRGLQAAPRVPSEEELVALLEKHTAVIAAVGWFEQDAGALEGLDALKFWHQHAVAVVGWEKGPNGVLFRVRDPKIPHIVRYTKAELDTNSMVAFVIEPLKAR